MRRVFGSREAEEESVRKARRKVFRLFSPEDISGRSGEDFTSIVKQ